MKRLLLQLSVLSLFVLSLSTSASICSIFSYIRIERGDLWANACKSLNLFQIRNDTEQNTKRGNPTKFRYLFVLLKYFFVHLLLFLFYLLR